MFSEDFSRESEAVDPTVAAEGNEVTARITPKRLADRYTEDEMEEEGTPGKKAKLDQTGGLQKQSDWMSYR